MKKLYHGDCLEVMPTLADQSIDMILCDLPFGTTSHKWDSIISLDLLWVQYKRLIKPNGAIILFGCQPFTTSLINSNRKGFKHCWVWQKEKGGNFAVTKYMPLMVTEDVLVFTAKGERVNYYPIMRTGEMREKGSGKSLKNGSGFGGLKNIIVATNDQYYPTNLLQFNGVFNSYRLHPAQKPIELLQYLVKTYSQEDNWILDNCMGSGSMAIACKNTDRNFIGIEKDANYFKIASERITNHQPLFDW